jgi:hypothetical protein
MLLTGYRSSAAYSIGGGPVSLPVSTDPNVHIGTGMTLTIPEGMPYELHGPSDL